VSKQELASHPRVTQLNVMPCYQLLVEVADVENEVLLLVEPQHFLHHAQWYQSFRNATAAPIY